MSFSHGDNLELLCGFLNLLSKASKKCGWCAERRTLLSCMHNTGKWNPVCKWNPKQLTWCILAVFAICKVKLHIKMRK